MAFYHIKYRLFAILWVLLPTIPTVSVANTTTLNVGCFNIRFKTTADQGELSWDNRKSYVARTIIDFKYDIVGVNERRFATRGYEKFTSGVFICRMGR